MTLYSIYYSEYGDDKVEHVAADHLPTPQEALEYLLELNDIEIELADIEGVYPTVASTLDGLKDTIITVREDK